MARVDFYVLAASDERARLTFACRLAEKAYRLDNRVHIHTRDSATAGELDALLWTFRDGSFVPHHVLDPTDGDRVSPVTIGCTSAVGEPRDLLINLCDEIPEIAEFFPRVAELVTSEDACRQAGRIRFAAYRDRGHSLETHKV